MPPICSAGRGRRGGRRALGRFFLPGGAIDRPPSVTHHSTDIADRRSALLLSILLAAAGPALHCDPPSTALQFKFGPFRHNSRRTFTLIRCIPPLQPIFFEGHIMLNL